uniref:Uncharacterized protein n=1 Tax=Anguilla anguilla TaxID=7936 RepID=A0A0E9QUM9_ANGAN
MNFQRVMLRTFCLSQSRRVVSCKEWA